MKSAGGDQPVKFQGRAERERTHFNRLAIQSASNPLTMAEENIRRYQTPPGETPFPLEYAFHLMGPLEGRTVVDLGCGDGLNTVLMAALGAHVISVDVSDESLRLTEQRAAVNGVAHNVRFVQSDAAIVPIDDNSADLVLCAAILHHVDCLATARQIRRILKPGGRAAFLEPLVGPKWLEALKRSMPRGRGVSEDEQPLTHSQVEAVSKAIGRAGRGRVFGLTMRPCTRLNIRSWKIVKASHQLDAWILRRVRFMRALASPFVWEAIKQAERV